MSKQENEKIMYFSTEILSLIQDKLEDDEDFQREVGENFTEFMFALSTVVPNQIYSVTSSEELNHLEFNHLMNNLCFQYMTMED